jgi:hypothetical protein
MPFTVNITTTSPTFGETERAKRTTILYLLQQIEQQSGSGGAPKPLIAQNGDSVGTYTIS